MITIKSFNAVEDSISFPKNALGDYHDTLGGCVRSVEARLAAAKVVLATSLAMDRPVNYGCTERWDFPIASLNGKPTKKYFHVNIYRLESGRYELNTYVL